MIKRPADEQILRAQKVVMNYRGMLKKTFLKYVELIRSAVADDIGGSRIRLYCSGRDDMLIEQLLVCFGAFYRRHDDLAVSKDNMYIELAAIRARMILDEIDELEPKPVKRRKPLTSLESIMWQRNMTAREIASKNKKLSYKRLVALQRGTISMENVKVGYAKALAEMLDCTVDDIIKPLD